jgi:hypothetical protein
MRHPTFPLSRTLWMVLCLLALLCFAAAADTRPPTGGPASGRHDHAAQNRTASVHKWLCALHQSTVQVWTREHRWFLRTCSRVLYPLMMTEPHRAVDDGSAEASDTIGSSEFAPLGLLWWPWPRAPGGASSNPRASHTPRACRSFTPIDSFLPRPPPAPPIV